MRKIVKSRLASGVLVLAVVALGTVIGGDVIVKEGTIEGEVFKSTGCTASGTKAIALGGVTTAEGNYSTSMGYNTQAIGQFSTAMGYNTQAIEQCSTATGYGTTAAGYCSIAMGYGTEAVGDYSTAMGCETEATDSYSTSMGYDTTASGWMSTAAGCGTTASGIVSTSMGGFTNATQFCSLAAGYYTDATAYYATAFGKYSTNNVANSFTVGYGTSPSIRKVDFKVESGLVTVNGNLYVSGTVEGDDWLEHSTFYDKEIYGVAMDYLADSSTTIKINAQGQKEYNHEADPQFLKKYVTVKDYDKYTDTKVWNAELQEYEPERVYETHQELRGNLSMKVAWLTQCVYELNQENEQLKAELSAIKAKLGME
jgi:hypothetical protein